MSDVKTSSVWHVTGARWIDSDPEVGCFVITVHGKAGDFAVVVSGHKAMDSNDIISALRVAAASAIRACGGDMSAVGCTTLDEAAFDTGDQRAN